MADFAVTIEQITVQDHPNADRLEIAKIKGYNCIVPKGKYTTGERVVYIPEGAVVPDDLLEKMGLKGKLAGSQGNRVKTVKLRGIVSQGLVTELTDDLRDIEVGQDVTDYFGIHKYVPEVPKTMSGEVEVCTDMLSWPDVENIKKYPHAFRADDLVVATEKIHGSCCITSMSRDTGFSVTSKGLLGKHLRIKENENNIYWNMAREYEIEEFLASYMERNNLHVATLYGEVFGSKVQDLTYGLDNREIDYRSFYLKGKRGDGTVTTVDAVNLPAIVGPWIPIVPVLYHGRFDWNKLWKIANNGKEEVSGKNTHIKEGVVIRPSIETDSMRKRLLRKDMPSHLMLKMINEDYLLRDNATELT